jgi:hypothetical protein
MSKVVLPSFSGEEYQPYELRQLVSALELRFQALEENDVSMFDTDTGFEFDDRYSQIGHTHTESEITDLRNYLLNIESESIFDLPDVTGTPANGDILQWNTVAAAFQAVPAGSSSFSLNDLDDVSVPAPTDGQVLTYDLGNLRWEAKGVGAGITSFVALTDTDLSGQQQYDMVYNATGSDWHDTDGELIWNPTSNYLQLANAHSINWQDTDASSTELLMFEAASGSGDPYFANVVLLLDMNGVDGGTTWTDLSDSAHTVTFANQAQLDTAQKKFGTASTIFDNADDYLEIANDADFHFLAGEFTIEAHIRLNTTAETNTIISQYQTQDQGWFFRVENDGYLAFAFSTTGVGMWTTIEAVHGMSTATWYHVAVERTGDMIHIYVDGTEIVPDVPGDRDVTGITFFESTFVQRIGALQVNAAISSEMDGWIDNIRVTKGVGRYGGSNFTAPTEEYPTTSDVTTFIVGDPAYPMQVDATSVTLGNAADSSFMVIDHDNGIVAESLSGGGLAGFEMQTIAATDSSYLDLFNQESGLEITLSTPGSTFGAGSEPHRFYFASFSADLDIIGDLGVGSAWARLREDTAVKYFDIADGTHFRIYDDTEVDYADFHHDGTDLNTTFVTTTQWNIDVPIVNLSGTNTNQLLLPQLADALTPTLAFGDGDTGFYEQSANVMYFAVAGTARWRWDTTQFTTVSSARASIQHESPSSTNPVFVIRNNDLTTGVGGDASEVSFIVSSEEIATVTATALDIVGGNSLRVLDSGNADWVEFNHDGVDLNTTFEQTTDWNITLLSGSIRTDVPLFVGDALNIISDIVTANPPTTEAVTVKNNYLSLTDAHVLAEQGFIGSNNFQFVNRMHGGEIFLRAESAAGTLRTLVHGNPDADVKLYDTGAEVARTEAAASGGFEVNNTLTGVGFERVLTTSDVGGGGLAAGTVTDSTLRWGGTTWDEETQIRSSAAGVFTVLDSSLMDSAAFSHDGNDFNAAFTNTVSWNITGLTVVEYFADVYNRSGSTLTMWDGADVDTFDLQHTGAHGQITTGGVAGGDIRMVPAGGAVDLRTGTQLRVRGATNTGYFEFSHDDTDALLRFFNTTDFDIRGATIKIWDDGFTDNAAFSHDGTDFHTVFTQTNDWNIGTITGQVNVTADAVQLLDDTDISIFSTSNANGTTLRQETTDFEIHGVVCTDLNIDGFTGAINLLDGVQLVIQDSGNTDTLTMQAGATNFSMTFFQQTHCNVIGLNGAFWVRDGASLRVSDTDDTDYVDMFHDAAGGIMHFNHINTSSVVFEDAASDFFVLDFANDRIINYAPIFMQEQAAANSDTAAFGQFWVRDDSPNTPMYTADAGGVDQVIDPSLSEINGQTADYTLVLSDKGKTIRFTGSTAAQTMTIPANGSVAYPDGTMIAFQNDSSVTVSIAITTDTMTGTDGTTGTRTLGVSDTAVVQKVASTSWKYAASDL